MTDVRERMAEVLGVWETRVADDGYPTLRARTGEELADAILSDSELVDALVRSRLEQVGWLCGSCLSRIPVSTVDKWLMEHGYFCHCPEPDAVYRIGAAPDPEGAQE